MDKVTESKRELAERTLGKGVHPQALDRLFELWPDAEIQVRHVKSRNDGVDLRNTYLTIHEFGLEEVGDPVLGAARCRLDQDTWDRRKGIGLAFRRALKEAKRKATPPSSEEQLGRDHPDFG